MYGTITVTGPTEDPAYELYYTLDSTTDSDVDKHIEYGVGETVTATVYAKAAQETQLQAFDLYITNDANLTYVAQPNVSDYGTRISNSTATWQHIQCIFEENSGINIDIGPTPVALATLKFTVADAAVYGTPMLITIKDESNLATANNTQSIKTDRDDQYKLTISQPVLGVETLETYPVTYNANATDDTITGIPAAQAKQHNVPLTLSSDVPTRTGYTFKGWATASGSNTVTYSAGAEYTANAALNLYAVWEQKTYTVTWYNGSTVLETDTGVPHGTKPSFDQADPTKDPDVDKTYTFIGWNEDADATSAADADKLPVVTKDTNYYAIFSASPRTYKVSFDLQGHGTTIPEQNVGYQGTVTKPDDPTDDNYVFGGWYKEAACTTPWDFTNDKVTADTTLYAKWTPKTFTVTLEENGGSYTGGYTEPTSYTYGVGLTLPTADNISRTGYTFAGWYDNVNCTGAPVTEITTTDSGNKTYYAKWTENTYTIKYNPGTGTGEEITIENVKYTDTITVKSIGTGTDQANFTAPQNSGFNGWLGSDNNSYTAGTSVSGLVSENGGVFTFTAQWEQDVFTITYELDGGTDPGNPSTYSKNMTTAITLINPTKNGYTFTGWSGTDLTGENNLSVTIPVGATGDRTYTAHWALNEYTITFDVDSTTTTAKYSITDNKTINDLQAAPTKNGYSFMGWQLNTASGNWETGSYPATTSVNGKYGDINLVATWRAESYTITFNVDGTKTEKGYATTDTNTLGNLFASPTKTGYTFAGWKLETATGGWEAKTYESTEPVTGKYGNVELTAAWNAITYHINYELDGGTLTGSNPQSYTIADTYSLATAEKTGYDFDGWKVTSDTNGTWTKGDTKPSNYTLNGDYGDVTLTAQWTPKTYTLTLNPVYTDGSKTIAGTLPEGTSTGVTVTYDGTYPTLPEPTANGYKFDGWFIGSVQISAGDTVKITADTEAVAHYSPITYTIKFNTDGGTAIANKTYTIEDTVNLPTAEGKASYSFVNWVVEETGGNWGTVGTTVQAGDQIGRYGDVTLKAVWSQSINYDLQTYKYAPDGYKLLIIDASDLADGTVYKYGDGNDSTMYYTTDENYLLTGSTAVFYTLVPTTSTDGTLTAEEYGEIRKVTLGADETRQTITYDGDVNGDNTVNIADANAVFQMVVNGGSYYPTQLTIAQRLAADMDKNNTGAEAQYRGSINDVNAIVSIINGVATTP